MGELRNGHADRWDFDKTRRILGLPDPFARGITFADLDIEEETRRHFLCIEGQRIGYALTKGQKLSADARVATGRTVFIVWGTPPNSDDRDDPGEIEYVQIWPGDQEPCDWAGFYALCARWFAWAETQAPPPIQPNALMLALYAERGWRHCPEHGLSAIPDYEGGIWCAAHKPWRKLAA